jgi:hypothetical protein
VTWFTSQEHADIKKEFGKQYGYANEFGHRRELMRVSFWRYRAASFPGRPEPALRTPLIRLGSGPIIPAVMTNTRTEAGDPPVAPRGAPITQRVVLVAILLVTLLVAYLDRVNVSVLVADDAFLKAMGIEGQPVSIGLLMTVFLVAYGVSGHREENELG